MTTQTINSNSTQKHTEALNFFNNKDYERAAVLFGESLIEKQTSDLWNDWATAKFLAGRASEAEAGFRRALEMEPENIQAVANLGTLLAGQQRYSEALSLIEFSLARGGAAEKEALEKLLVICREGLTRAASAAEVSEQFPPQPKDRVPSEEFTTAFRKWKGTMEELKNLAHNLSSRFPQDRDARFLLAQTLQGAGMEDLALIEYKALLENCPANERYRVQQGIQQCQADRNYFPPTYAKRLTTAEYAAGHNAEVWRDYAKREIQRGREIVRMVRQVTTLRGKRVLDVGSGYGGMLISMAEQGAEVVGVEIDPERTLMGRKRLADLGMEIPYHQADICTPGIEEELGTFDVVICQDVLEHVLDPTSVIRSLCKMLRPNGLIYIQIPNKYGVDQLMSDHHYSLVGITALSRPQAIEYWQLATGEAPEHYGVGYERGEKYYASAFAHCGVRLTSADRYPGIDYVLWYATRIKEMCARIEKEIYPGLRPELQKRIRHRMAKVAKLYARASERIIQAHNQPEFVAEASDAVVRRLCSGLWRFIGIKEPGRGQVR